MPHAADELSVTLLRRLAEAPQASQRELARDTGVSLGKLNYALRALIDMAWLWLTLHREQACRMFAGLHRVLFGRRRGPAAVAETADCSEAAPSDTGDDDETGLHRRYG